MSRRDRSPMATRSLRGGGRESYTHRVDYCLEGVLLYTVMFSLERFPLLVPGWCVCSIFRDVFLHPLLLICVQHSCFLLHGYWRRVLLEVVPGVLTKPRWTYFSQSKLTSTYVHVAARCSSCITVFGDSLFSVRHCLFVAARLFRRTSVLAGEVSAPSEALEHVASCKGVAMERLTIPSQRRYLSYFSSVMEGVRYAEMLS